MLKRVAVVLLSTLIANLGGWQVTLAQTAQTARASDEKVDLDAINKIKEEGLKRSQVMEILSYLTDVYGPRLTASPNYKAASEWAKQKLAEWGAQNARLEAWGPFGRGWTVEGFAVNVVKPQFVPLIAYPKAWSPSTKGPVRGEAIYLDAENEADLEKYKGKLKGAIVLVAPPRTPEAHFSPEAVRLSEEGLLRLANAGPPGAGGGRRPQQNPEQRAAQALLTKKWQLAASEGASVVLDPGRGDGGNMIVQSVTIPTAGDAQADRRPRPWAKDAPAVPPQAVLTVEHYNRIVRMLKKGVKVELEVNIATQFHEQDLMGYNVIAEIPGSDLKDEVVMLGAHFDSWHSGTGATDNAAGSAVCMEAVRIIQALGLKPRRTIRIGLWGGEEQGLLGSRAFVNERLARRIDTPGPQGQPGPNGGTQAQDQRPPQYEFKPDYSKFSGYFNLDNGTGKIRGIYMQGNEALRPIFRAWLAPFADLGASTLSLSNTGGTDHQAFDGVGLPGFQFIQDPVEYNTRTHHYNMDVYERIQAEDMKQASVIMAAFVYNTAMRNEKLPRKPMR